MTETEDIPMSNFALPTIRGPHDLPELRSFLIRQWRQGGVLDGIPDCRFMRRNLPTAQLWWVEPEACDLLAASAPTWPDDAVLDLADVPTPCGLAVFAHDLIGTDADPRVEGRQVYVSAILWAPAQLPDIGGEPSIGISIVMFSRIVMDDGLTPDQWQWAQPDLLAIDELLTARRIGPETTQSFNLTGHLFAYVGRTDWLEGWTPDRIIADNPHGENPYTAASQTEDRKLLAALWALVRSPVITSVRTHPPRHIARRAQRQGHEATVRVLRLGGEKRENIVTGERTVNWKHQWVVSPHYRWQPYGPRSEGRRRVILVGPYTKGPEGAPLLGGERVWRVAPPKDLA